MNPSPPLEAGVVDALQELAQVTQPPRFCPGCGVDGLVIAPMMTTHVAAYDCHCTGCGWLGDISPEAKS